MLQTQHGTGCFEATFPNKAWKQVPCGQAPTHPYASEERAVHHLNVGGGFGDYLLQSDSGSIISTTGSLRVIANVTSVTGFNLPNEFSVQLNTNTFTTASCSNANCRGWVQYVLDSGGGLIIQAWLIGYLTPAVTNCPSKSWNTSGNSCWQNIASKTIPITQFANLGGVTITGEADRNGNDTVTMALNGSLSQATAPDSVMHLAGAWTSSEFNVFGESSGVQATFNPGSIMSVLTTLNEGTAGFPTCVSGGSTTAETTNLSLGPCSTAQNGSGGQRGIQFVEGVLPVITGISPASGSQDGGTAVTISGTGFTNNMEASFGSDSVGMFNQCSGTRCTLSSPRGTGTVDITVGNLLPQLGTPGPFSAITAADRFTYQLFPGGSMSPSSGAPAGGTRVTVTGHDFSTAPGGTAISFALGGAIVPAVDVSCSTATQCALTTPALNQTPQQSVVTPVSVTVGGKTGSLGGFTYLVKTTPPPPPTCAQCQEDGGTCVVVNGKFQCRGPLK